MSQLAPLNSTATFFCRAIAISDLVIWYVNGDAVDYRNQGTLRQRGFTFIDINVPPEVNKTMSVTASLQNNNTNIKCATVLGQREQIATANLLVAGKQQSRATYTLFQLCTLFFCVFFSGVSIHWTGLDYWTDLFAIKSQFFALQLDSPTNRVANYVYTSL